MVYTVDMVYPVEMVYTVDMVYTIDMVYTVDTGDEALLLGHWYEIMAHYYVKSILTEISASKQDRRVLQKSKIIRIKILSIWGILQTSGSQTLGTLTMSGDDFPGI